MCTQSRCGRFPDFKLSSSFQFSVMFHISSFVRFEFAFLSNSEVGFPSLGGRGGEKWCGFELP